MDIAARRKSVVSDPEEMLLLREKLNQIAVGLQFRRDAAPDDDDNDMDDEDELDECERRRRHRRRATGGHFKVFPLLGDRPSTPPSSPQPRDFLRKQLRLRNSSFRLDDLPSHQRDGSFDAMDSSVCVDGVEITRLDGRNVQSPLRSVSGGRLSIPGHLRVRSSSSSFSVLTKNPEGLRKRKSDHVADERPDETDAAPLKKVSSQKNMLAAAATWDYDALAGDASGNNNRQWTHQQPQQSQLKDHEMEDVSPESPDSVGYTDDLTKLCS